MKRPEDLVAGDIVGTDTATHYTVIADAFVGSVVTVDILYIDGGTAARVWDLDMGEVVPVTGNAFSNDEDCISDPSHQYHTHD